MRCSNCNSENVSGDKFCRYCGCELNAEEKVDDNTKFVQAYVGYNYDSFMTGTFNVGAFFFGPVYLLYRKMYLYAFAFIFISILASFFFPLVANIVLGFVVNGLYLSHARDKVRFIKTQNKDLSETELLEKCKKMGGTTFIPVIIYYVINLIFLVFVFWIFYLIIKEEDRDTIDNEQLYNTNVEVVYDVPTNFERIKNENEFVSMNDNHYCRIKSYNSYKLDAIDDKEYVEQGAEDNDIITQTINGNTWYSYIEKGYSKESIHTYISIKEDKVFCIEYTIYSDYDKYCSDSLKPFINSLKLVDKSGVEA